MAADEAARPVVREEARSLLHDLDNRFVDRVLGWAVDRFGSEADPDDLFAEYPEIGDGGYEFLVPWSVYHHEIDGLPPFEWYARENDSLLSRREREWIEAQRRSWMSVWEVRESVPGKSMILVDLFTGEQRLVQEAKASRLLVIRDAILARVVDLGSDSILVGTHRHPLPPLEASRVADAFRRHVGAPLPLPVETLRREAGTLALAAIWTDFVEKLRTRDLPQLRNTDGDVLRFITDEYRFDESAREAVVAALTSIRGAGDIDEGGVITFQKRGDNTVVGTAFLSDSELQLETNSSRRANSLRKKVEKACGDLLSEHLRSEEDPREGLMAGLDDAEDIEDEVLADEIVVEEKRKYYATWPDLPIPALGDKTPRQAARSRRGRKELATLLKQLEHHEAHQPLSVRFDVNILRRELGIDDPEKA